MGSLPFFYGLYQAFELLGWVARDQACSQEAVLALRRIKYSALVVLGFLVGVEAYIVFRPHDGDDHAGGVAMGVFLGFPCLVAATAAGVLERILRNAVALKAENDLTV
ncbi:MAG: DUF2975 domain-containing protein [Planctomycetota bacterium]